MDISSPSYVFVLLGILAIILEVILGAATGFELFVLGIAAILAGGVGIWLGSTTVTLVTFVSLIIVYLLGLRGFIKTKLNAGTTKTSTDRIIGEKAEVTKMITPSSPGQIRVDDETWRATSSKEQPIGKQVEVVSVSGVTVKVE